MKPEVVCEATAHRCACVLPAGHDGPHECGVECYGAWEGMSITADDFRVVRLPDVMRSLR